MLTAPDSQAALDILGGESINLALLDDLLLSVEHAPLPLLGCSLWEAFPEVIGSEFGIRDVSEKRHLAP